MTPFLLIFILPVLLATGLIWGGIWAWSPLLYAFGVIPLMELFWKPDPRNLGSEEEEEAFEDDFDKVPDINDDDEVDDDDDDDEYDKPDNDDEADDEDI